MIFLDFSDIIAQRGVVTDTVSGSCAIDREGDTLEIIADLTQLQPSRLTAQRDWGILTAYIIQYWYFICLEKFKVCIFCPGLVQK